MALPRLTQAGYAELAKLPDPALSAQWRIAYDEIAAKHAAKDQSPVTSPRGNNGKQKGRS